MHPKEAQITGFASISCRALKHFRAESSLSPFISNTPRRDMGGVCVRGSVCCTLRSCAGLIREDVVAVGKGVGASCRRTVMDVRSNVTQC
jgi:hypothetical protein